MKEEKQMPNWCDNNLYISHPEKKMMKKALNAWNSGKFLSTLVPEPDYTKVKVKHTFPINIATGEPKPEFVDPETAWYDWRIQNWGTKWDIGWENYQDKAKLSGDHDMFVTFQSAWSPPTDAYATLIEMGYSIRAYYFEGGCAFCGRWEDGIEDFYNLDFPDGVSPVQWVKDNIPTDIDGEMAISDSYEGYEEYMEQEKEDA
jgi:hypothetical protein